MTVLSEQERIDILADIVNINTENNNEIEVCYYLKELLQRYDIESKIIEIEGKRSNLVAEIGSGRPVIGISGHMDVVDAGDKAQWMYPPFELHEEDGKLYGRGTSDMKGGLAALVIAMIEIKASNLLQQGTIRLLATAAEEKEMSGSMLFRDKGYVDDLDGLIIGEPSDHYINYANKGSMGIKIKAKGVAAHSSLPNLGHNAIDDMIRYIQKIKEKYEDIKNNDNKHSLDVSPLIKDYFGDKFNDKELRKLENVAEGLVIVNSIIYGGEQFNTVPESAYAEFNIRTIPEYDNEAIIQLFEETLEEVDQAQLSMEITTNHAPVYSNKDNLLVKSFTEYKDDLTVTALVGATDASELLKGIDNVDLTIIGPGFMRQAHRANEYIDKQHYLDFIDLYQHVIVDYLNKKSN
ncbi:ArgE/DapE family deacylase [Staphylococcus lugdunensis]|uniref:ArgE/DapE family deacylase n=1 Tax=Staphylococcus lugdunensis TaxID=28035 RepID=UPI00076B6FAF|nr:ArgE/DapE family deacylase [Staphylococcus lugdunensis]AMG64108.1 succinyl-diaminopimelate desuccinylase [Staphylococcus lugdunensis]MDU1965294.1 ArgE/DapE family deacylase [Staphylococcus lugdunensis]